MLGPLKVNTPRKKKHQHIKYCPLLKSCRYMVTIHYFRQICNTGAHPKCRYYSKKTNQLKTPLQWLQKLVVEEAKMVKRHSLMISSDMPIKDKGIL